MSLDFIALFKDTLNWISENVQNEVKGKGIINEIVSSKRWEEFVSLTSIEKMSEIVYNDFSENLLILWQGIEFADPNAEKISNQTKKEQLYDIAYRIVDQLLQYYTIDFGTTLENKNIIALQQKWYEFLKRPYNSYEATTYLLNIEIESKEINLNSDIIIKRLTDQEIKKIKENLFRTEFLSKVTIIRFEPKIILKKLWRYDFSSKSQTPQLNKDFNRILCIFRLIKSDWIDIDIISEYRSIDYFNNRGQYNHSTQKRKKKQGKLPFEIKKNEEENFKTDWNILNSIIPSFKEFPVWLIRYFNSYGNKRSDDALIDLSISIESLLNDGLGEMTHKISTRAAILLTYDYKGNFNSLVERRKEIRKYIKDTYSIRSSIVHGSDKKITFEIISEFREYIRKIIKKMILLDKSVLNRKSWESAKKNIIPYIDFDKIKEKISEISVEPEN